MTAAPLLGCVALACGVDRAVLADVSLSVHAGESWFVLGGNGAGKTTLLQTLLGLLPPRAGAVLPPCGGAATPRFKDGMPLKRSCCCYRHARLC